MAATLGVNKYQVIGHLQALWWWGIDNATLTGDLKKGTSAGTIAQAAGWSQDAEKFLEVLIQVQFVDSLRTHLRLHNFYDYAGKLLTKRIQNRDRMRAARALHVQCTNPARASNVQGYRTQPYPTVPNPTEENSTVPKDESTGAVAPPTAKEKPTVRKNRTTEAIELSTEFRQLADLKAFKPGEHTAAEATIKAACADAGVPVEGVVRQFCGDWQRLKYEYGWGEPMRPLSKNIGRQISNYLLANKGGQNGKSGNSAETFVREAARLKALEEDQRKRRLAFTAGELPKVP